MKRAIKNIFILSIIAVLFSCTTMKNETLNSKISTTESFKITGEIKAIEKTTAKNPIFYGNNGEVQAYKDSNSKLLYITGSLNALNMTDKDIALNTIDLSRIKVKEETLNGKNGIVLAFYDILVFLEEKDTTKPATVGVFEHQRGEWVFGEDIDNSDKSILIKIDNNRFAGPIKIGTRNISRAYN